MLRIELDMGFAVEELERGLEKLFGVRCWDWTRHGAPGQPVVYEIRLDSGTARVTAQAMPEERRAPLTIPPRSLLTIEVDGPDEDEIAARLRRDVLLAFLRSGG